MRPKMKKKRKEEETKKRERAPAPSRGVHNTASHSLRKDIEARITAILSLLHFFPFSLINSILPILFSSLYLVLQNWLIFFLLSLCLSFSLPSTFLLPFTPSSFPPTFHLIVFHFLLSHFHILSHSLYFIFFIPILPLLPLHIPLLHLPSSSLPHFPHSLTSSPTFPLCTPLPPGTRTSQALGKGTPSHCADQTQPPIPELGLEGAARGGVRRARGKLKYKF